MLLFVVCAASLYRPCQSMFYECVWVCVCMFMRGRARMGIVHGLWGVSSLGSLEGQLGGDCKYSVCVCLCVCCVCFSRPGRGTAVGLCPGLQGGIRTTLTHTVLLLSLLFYPSHDPSFTLSLSHSSFSSHFSVTISFPQLSVSLFSVPLHLLICVVLAVISGGAVRNGICLNLGVWSNILTNRHVRIKKSHEHIEITSTSACQGLLFVRHTASIEILQRNTSRKSAY